MMYSKLSDTHPCFVTASEQGQPISIQIVHSDHVNDWLEQLSSAEKTWALAQGADGRDSKVILFPDQQGAIAKIGAVINACDLISYAKIPQSLPEGHYVFDGLNDDKALETTALAWALSQYEFTKYTKSQRKLRLLHLPSSKLCRQISRLAHATQLTRDLINTPTNDMGPTALAQAVKTVADNYGAVYDEITGDALLEQNFPAIHAVGRAGAEEPRLIDLVWGRADAPKLTLVGKGVCFDTGGLDIKPSAGMRLMKKDMGGAAHALALAAMIMDAELPVRLRLIIPAVENAIAGNAYRPGDIISTRKGLSVEVGNTDAEGRIILCDALALADEEKPEVLIDFATLTGAARVALGTDLPALFTPSDTFATAVYNIGQDQLDPLWRLPLWQPYAEGLKSPIADLNNMSDGPFAGAITAALYLDKFVEQAETWAHFDVFGWNVSDRPGRPKGGEAMGIRAVFSYLQSRFNH